MALDFKSSKKSSLSTISLNKQDGGLLQKKHWPKFLNTQMQESQCVAHTFQRVKLLLRVNVNYFWPSKVPTKWPFKRQK